MNQTSILLPALALMGWTFLVLLLVPFRRFKAAFAGKVTVYDFKFGESEKVPGDVSLPNRNYMNLLEMPMLFYVVSIILYVTQNVGPLTLALAWAYVGARVVHSLIHLTFNKVIYRFSVFVVSSILLLAIWVNLLLALVK